MEYNFDDQRTGSFLSLETEFNRSSFRKQRSDQIYLIWNRNKERMNVEIDQIPVELGENQLTTVTHLQTFTIQGHLPLTVFAFNRSFYCVHTNDEEISCNGFIFYGTSETPLITLPDEETKKFELLLDVFIDEFRNRDHIQEEMLRMLMKRLIIKITRIAREQLAAKDTPKETLDVIREYNQLVDQHFKTHKQVADYADLMHRSPKTLSNVFSEHSAKSPLLILHERIVLEAKKLLLHTSLTAKEISYELGFTEVSSFHKVFRKLTNQSPKQFREEKRKNEQVVGKS